MRRIDELSKAQRVVVVIGLGLALGALGSYLVSLGSSGFVFTPVPISELSGPGIGLHPWLRLIIWLVLIAVWALASVRALRPSSENDPSE